MIENRFEEELYLEGFRCIAGIDEAGRGPLAGPVVAAAVILPKNCSITGINDSKQLTPRKRDILFGQIIEEADGFGTGIISNEEIDRINILQATFRAMEAAEAALPQRPDYVLVDGNKVPDIRSVCRALVKGDSLSRAIAAASIIAKVTRDRIMVELDEKYPVYGFAKNKGYGTKQHRAAINIHGLSPVHRRSFCRNSLNLNLFDILEK